MAPVRIFWHQVGREHGMGEYTADLRANPPEVIEAYLRYREENAKICGFRLDEHTFVEKGIESVIMYFADLGLQYSRGHKSFQGWLVDVVSVSALPSTAICIRDLFFDIQVHGDGFYEVLDRDEFEWACREGVLDPTEIGIAQGSLEFAIDEVKCGRFPSSRLRAACDAVGWTDI